MEINHDGKKKNLNLKEVKKMEWMKKLPPV